MAKDFKSFLVILQSNFDKSFGFFVSEKLKKTNQIKTKKQLAFYFINGNQLITCQTSFKPYFLSNDEFFIGISSGMGIYNDRERKDWAWLNGDRWMGI